MVHIAESRNDDIARRQEAVGLRFRLCVFYRSHLAFYRGEASRPLSAGSIRMRSGPRVERVSRSSECFGGGFLLCDDAAVDVRNAQIAVIAEGVATGSNRRLRSFTSRCPQINGPACQRSRQSSSLRTGGIQRNLFPCMRKFGKCLIILDNLECPFRLLAPRSHHANRRTT